MVTQFSADKADDSTIGHQPWYVDNYKIESRSSNNIGTTKELYVHERDL